MVHRIAVRTKKRPHEQEYETDSDTEIDLRKSSMELERLHFDMVNERIVEDITMDVFYKPHTITVLICMTVYLIAKAFIGSSDSSSESNIYEGFVGAIVLFLIVSSLTFPNGPFIRPHPIIWRLIFGFSVLYLLILQFALFQTYVDIKKVLTFLDPDGLGKCKLAEKTYAENCNDISWEKIASHMDFFAFAHFTGWVLKALLIRHGVLCWFISIAWELTELVFIHLLPNFAECWWDAIALDIFLCNGLGIWLGLKICKFFQMREYKWESMKKIKTKKGRVARFVLQFTPEEFSTFEWYRLQKGFRRVFTLFGLVFMWLLIELNTFFIKHIFAIDTQHPIVGSRIILIVLIAAPSIRQYYVYVTDKKTKRLGMQCWVFIAIAILEAAICVKNGKVIFSKLEFIRLLVWICVLIFGTFICVWLSVVIAQKSPNTKSIFTHGEAQVVYDDSSDEHLGPLEEDVKKRRLAYMGS